MICLSVAGAFIAGVHYFAVDLPQQNAVTAPANEVNMACMSVCQAVYSPCRDRCDAILTPREYLDCTRQCEAADDACMSLCM